MSTNKYHAHRFDLKMTSDQSKLEQFLNSLKGEIIAIIPNVTMGAFWVHRVDFLLIVEKIARTEVSCSNYKCRANVVHTTWSFRTGFL